MKRGINGEKRADVCKAEDVAKLCNLTPARIRQMAREGIIPPPDRGLYDRWACVNAYIRHLQERAMGKQPTRETEERQRLLLEKARLEHDRAAGKLLLLDEVHSVVALIWRTAANHFRSLGSRLRPELGHEAQKRIDDETQRILETASRELAGLGARA